MKTTKIFLAALTLAAAIAVAGQASAEKLKATLNGASEVPANTSKGTGTVAADYDSASKKIDLEADLFGSTGPATAAHFHGPADATKNAGVAVPIPNATSSPAKAAPR